MKIFLLILGLLFSFSCANESDYKVYINEELGVRFEYPSWADVEETSRNGNLNVWIHIGEWPEKLDYIGDKPPRSPVSGVSFSVKANGSFQDFLAKERAGFIKGGYEKDIKETEFSIAGNIKGVEFVRNAKDINKTMHYFLFPSIKKEVVLSLWHLQDMETGFMGYPEEEAKAVNEYHRIIKSIRVFK